MVGSTRPPFPSAPSEPSLRRLGTGSASSGDRPIRAQLVVALVALIILLAVPLYLWRRPSTRATGSDAGVPSASSPLLAATALPPAVLSAPFRVEPVRASPLQRVRCGASRAKATASVPCDALPALERAFVEAIQKTPDCAPKTAKEGSINYVLEVDFVKKSIHVFPGQSGDWHGPSSRRATKCVEHALGKPDLASMTHNYAYYALAVLAAYPGAGAVNIVAPNASAISAALIPSPVASASPEPSPAPVVAPTSAPNQ
jgi:hypothetical protein